MLSGSALSERCRLICDGDPDCVAYTVGRPASFLSQLYKYEVVSNCCIERREYPPGVFVDATAGGGGRSGGGKKTKKTHCQHETMCWTRYEKVKRTEEASSSQSKRPCDSSNSDALGSRGGPSKVEPGASQATCTLVWEPTTYTDAELSEHVDFVSGGCDHNDTELERLLEAAHDVCEREVLDEALAASLAVSIVSHVGGVVAYIDFGGGSASGSASHASSSSPESSSAGAAGATSGGAPGTKDKDGDAERERQPSSEEVPDPAEPETDPDDKVRSSRPLLCAKPAAAPLFSAARPASFCFGLQLLSRVSPNR